MPNFLEEQFGVRQALADTAPPTSGTWNTFDMVYNSSPAVGTPWAWICTSGGTSGTWTPVSNLSIASTVTANSAAANVAVTANIVSITGAGGYNLTIASPAATSPGTTIFFTNASSGTVTFVAATGTAIVGTATLATNLSGELRSSGTTFYRVA